MKKLTIVVFISFMILVCGLGAVFASPTLDGTLDASQYTLAFSTTTQARVGFSVGTCDCSAIYYAYDANSVYFFVQGRIDGTGNGMILMIGSSATAGYPAGYNLGNTNSGNGVFSLGAGSNGNWEMDFPVSVGIEVNAFSGLVPSGSNLFYVNDAIYFNASSFATSGYIGGISANGGVVNYSSGNGVSHASVSYNNSGNSAGVGSSNGLEVALPRVGSALGTLTTGVKLQAFAIIVSQTGYFDDDGVPTNFPAVFGDNLNFGASTIDNPGPNHITTAAFGSYTWNTTVGCYTIASNWSPVRNSPAGDDILTFNGSLFSLSSCTAVNADFAGQLNIINNCTAEFMTSALSNTVTLGTTDVVGPALYVAASSQLILGGFNTGILFKLQPYSVGTINGDVVFAQTAAVTNQLTSQTTNGIVFTNGATCQDAPKSVTISANPFGTTGIISTGSVLFQSGSYFYQGGTKTGGWSGATTGLYTPFGFTPTAANPASVVTFQSGSYYWIYELATNDVFDARTVGYFIMDNRNGSQNMPGNIASVVILNDLVCESTQTGQVTATTGVNSSPIDWLINGNFIIQSGAAGFLDKYQNNPQAPFAVLGNFSCAGTFIPNPGNASPAYNRIYVLSGSSPQTLMLTTTINTPLSNLSTNNSSGIVMQSNVSVCSSLYMVAGNITTGSYTLSLGSTNGQAGFGNLKRTSGTIIGNLARWVTAGSSGVDFPVGTANSFNDASVVFAGGGATTAGILTTTFTPSNPGTNGLPLTDGTLVLDTVNPAGYWTINGNATTGSSTTAGVALTANGFTFSGLTANARIVYRLNSSSPWTLVGSAGSNSSTQIVRTGITNATPWGDFAIAESNLPPYAGFTATPSSGNGPLAVHFGDTSLNIPTSWSWNFGDGNTGNTQNTTYTYAAVGAPTTYTVTLIVTNSFGTTTATQPITVTEAPPSAAFSATSTSGNGPLPIQFNDGSSYPTSSAYTTWAWSFGDGNTSNVQNPNYSYAAVTAPTTYTVQLVVTTPFGSSTATQTNYISVSEAPPSAAFSATSTSGNGPLPIQFNDGSSYPTSSAFTTWSWTFGDGNTSNAQNPNYTYMAVSAPTTYTVVLAITTPFGSSTSTQTSFISVSESGPVVSFYANPSTGNGAYTATFVDTSNYPASNVTTFKWVFGDGASAGFGTSTVTTHQYNAVSAPTTYTAWEIVSTSFGVSSSSRSVSVSEAGPTAMFGSTPLNSYGPLTVNFTDESINLNGNSTTWSWKFGDGQTSSSQNPTNVYATVAAPTSYTVQLIVTTNFGMSTATTVISVTEPPPSAFSLLTPVANLTTNIHQQLFSWSTSTDIVGSSMTYNLQLGLDTGFTSIVTTINSISSTTQTISGLPNGVIYWQVQSVSSFGTTGSAIQQILLFDTTDKEVVASSETVTFYVGDTSGVYLPVTIFFTSTGADTITVTNINSKAPNLPTSYYISRYWIITPTVTMSNLTANITFSYTTSDYSDSGVTAEGDLYPAWDTTAGNNWVSILANVSLDTPANSAVHTLTVTGVTHFSDWTLGGPNGAVPVELSNFEVVNEDIESPILKP